MASCFFGKERYSSAVLQWKRMQITTQIPYLFCRLRYQFKLPAFLLVFIDASGMNHIVPAKDFQGSGFQPLFDIGIGPQVTKLLGHIHLFGEPLPCGRVMALKCYFYPVFNGF